MTDNYESIINEHIGMAVDMYIDSLQDSQIKVDTKDKDLLLIDVGEKIAISILATIDKAHKIH